MKKINLLIICLSIALAKTSNVHSNPLDTMPFYRTFINLTLGSGWKNIEEGIQKSGIDGFLKDWKTSHGACELLPALLFDLIADAQDWFSGNKENAMDQWQPGFRTSIGTLLAARTLLPGYQKELFTDTSVSLISSWLVNDVRQALIIFGKLTPQEAHHIAIVPLSERTYENWDYVQMLWLGIVPTKNALYVDETFLAQFRHDPLMYGFILSYGIEHYKNNTVRNRTFINMVNVGLRTFIAIKMFAMISNGITQSAHSIKKTCEHHTPGIAVWKSRPFAWCNSLYKGADKLSWIPYLGVCGVHFIGATTAWITTAMLADSIDNFCMGFYDKTAKVVQRKILRHTSGSINMHHLCQNMQQWLLYYNNLLTTMYVPSTQEYKDLAIIIDQQRHYTFTQTIEHIKNHYFTVWLNSEKERALDYKNSMQNTKRSRSFIDNSSRLAIFENIIRNLTALRVSKMYRKIIR